MYTPRDAGWPQSETERWPRWTFQQFLCSVESSCSMFHHRPALPAVSRDHRAGPFQIQARCTLHYACTNSSAIYMFKARQFYMPTFAVVLNVTNNWEQNILLVQEPKEDGKSDNSAGEKVEQNPPQSVRCKHGNQFSHWLDFLASGSTVFLSVEWTAMIKQREAGFPFFLGTTSGKQNWCLGSLAESHQQALLLGTGQMLCKVSDTRWSCVCAAAFHYTFLARGEREEVPHILSPTILQFSLSILYHQKYPQFFTPGAESLRHW